MAKIVLASSSPRRQELLQRIGITDFTVRVPEADESYNPNMTPEEIVCHISRKKSVALTSAEDEIVITADTMVFLVRQGQHMLTRATSTHVYFRSATEHELRAYIRGGEPMDKAGSYGVQGQGALLVERIDGDFFNVMGLPVLLLSQMLRQFGIDLFR